MRKRFGFIVCFCTLFSTQVGAWNALGHRIIAQIAYDHMAQHAKHRFNQYNHALDVVYKPLSWTYAAAWLDKIRYQNVGWFDFAHYVDFPFSEDGTEFPLQEANALWAINKAIKLVTSPYPSDFDKGIALRVLLHVVGDVHQPLHTITKVSRTYPKGDKGGNLVLLAPNPIAKNLHAYWDRGAGLLISKNRVTGPEVKQMALTIETAYPCPKTMDMDPIRWAKESHEIAIRDIYKPFAQNLILKQSYQKASHTIAMQQIALAGCRLGALLNQLDVKVSDRVRFRGNP